MVGIKSKILTVVVGALFATSVFADDNRIARPASIGEYPEWFCFGLDIGNKDSQILCKGGGAALLAKTHCKLAGDVTAEAMDDTWLARFAEQGIKPAPGIKPIRCIMENFTSDNCVFPGAEQPCPPGTTKQAFPPPQGEITQVQFQPMTVCLKNDGAGSGTSSSDDGETPN